MKEIFIIDLTELLNLTIFTILWKKYKAVFTNKNELNFKCIFSKLEVFINFLLYLFFYLYGQTARALPTQVEPCNFFIKKAIFL